MDSNDLLKFCLEKGLLLDRDLFNLFRESFDLSSAKIIIEKIQNFTHTKILTKRLFFENQEKFDKLFLDLPSENKQNLESLKIKLGLSIEISREIPKQIIEETNDLSGVKILSTFPNLSKKLEVKDFISYFRGRYSEMSKFLQGHSNLKNLISINKLSNSRQSFSIIGLVSNKSFTKNKNLILEVEDLTGKIKMIVSKDKKEVYSLAEEIPLDSVLGFSGSGSREIFFVNEIVAPDTGILEKKFSPFDESILFIGDLHIGSKLFMEKNFLKFVDYLNGNVPGTEEEVKKIKYILLCGDLVSGVGIYPNQDSELTIQDVESQYSRAAELLDLIPKNIKIIISPGNHDAVRIMEPQPVLDEKFAWKLYELKNIFFVSNPSIINVGAKTGFSGFNILNYHGYSYHFYAGNISKLILEKAAHKPELVMQYLLKYRHLAPTHSSTLYFPSEFDPFIISESPDVFVSAHTHKSAVSIYNNILLISTSAWESLTAYQEKMGNEPDFCKVPMFNLKTRAIKMLDFE